VSVPLRVDAGLGLAHLPTDDRLRPILRGALRAPRGARLVASPWPAALFDLHRVGVVAAASPQQQAAILDRCADAVLQEALHIEAIGMAFAAKMLLLSDTVEERMLYSAFAADEARHLAGFLAFAERRATPGPFLASLAEWVETGDRATLVLLVQVVLEGWGLDHYRRLAQHCQNPALAPVFRGVLVDEARHHGSGVHLASRCRFDAASEPVVAALRSLCALVGVGPWSVITAIEAELGPLGDGGRLRALRELDGEVHAATRLALLRSLLHKGGADAVADVLERDGAWRPRPSEQVVEVCG
jgi:tRNA isopentenyl-2-thiomethyl-A-37 hydroxylase MiaE